MIEYGSVSSKQLVCFAQGKVPRNEYGNLELFKPSMLPVGAAHIPSKNQPHPTGVVSTGHCPSVL